MCYPFVKVKRWDLSIHVTACEAAIYQSSWPTGSLTPPFCSMVLCCLATVIHCLIYAKHPAKPPLQCPSLSQRHARSHRAEAYSFQPAGLYIIPTHQDLAENVPNFRTQIFDPSGGRQLHSYTSKYVS